MRTTARTLSLALLAIALGCGKKEEEQKPVDMPLTPEPIKPGVVADKDPEPNTPKEPAAVWEMDAGKHKMPRSAAEGKLAGGDFKTTSARIRGGTLTVAMGADRSFALEFQLPPGQLLENRTVVVRSEQEPGPNVPVVSLKAPAASGGMPTDLNLVNGFALTLELGPRTAGKVPGKIYLSTPFDDKSFVAGEFTADWERLDTDPPGPEQAPYVQGKLAIAGVPTPVIKAGYVGKPAQGAFVSDSQDLSLEGPNAALFTRSIQSAPRMTTIHAGTGKDSPARYEHVNLPPGRYFVYVSARKDDATLPKGTTPSTDLWAVGKWVGVGEKGEITLDLALDAAAVGTVEVKAPPGTGKVTVMLAPVEEPGITIDDGLFQGAALSLGTSVDAKDGKAAIARVPPGKYEARAYEEPTPNGPMRLVGMTQTVDVVAGKTATVDLNLKK